MSELETQGGEWMGEQEVWKTLEETLIFEKELRHSRTLFWAPGVGNEEEEDVGGSVAALCVHTEVAVEYSLLCSPGSLGFDNWNHTVNVPSWNVYPQGLSLSCLFVGLLAFFLNKALIVCFYKNLNNLECKLAVSG